MMGRRSTKAMAVLGLAAALVVAGAIAYAGIPDAGGVIHGCYNNTNGEVRLIDPNQSSCRIHEAAISWNQEGPQGPQGPKGDKGDKGDQGDQGPKGDPGVSNRTVETLVMTLGPGEAKSLTKTCPAGTTSLGGGFDSQSDAVRIVESTPFLGGGVTNGWKVRAINDGASSTTVFIDVVCATVNP